MYCKVMLSFEKQRKASFYMQAVPTESIGVANAALVSTPMIKS